MTSPEYSGPPDMRGKVYHNKESGIDTNYNWHESGISTGIVVLLQGDSK